MAAQEIKWDNIYERISEKQPLYIILKDIKPLAPKNWNQIIYINKLSNKLLKIKFCLTVPKR